MLKPWFVLPLIAGIGGFAGGAGAAENLIVATTTSMQDSGLLDVLVPAFEAKTHLKLKTIAVGSGEALAMGKRGDADVLLVHSPAAEEAFMSEGQGEKRLAVMHNDFVLIGPGADPAGVKGLDIIKALEKIAAAKAPFASRGDQSGTHKKELDLWRKAGIDPAGQGWYFSTGQGIGETAHIAAGKQAYTLIDRGTCLAMGARLGLPILCEDAKDLLNSYHVIVVSPEKHPKVHVRAARRFAEWIVSPRTQKLIGDFGRAKYGRSLFVPDAK